MTITIEKKLRDFHFWGGAATNAAKLSPDELDRLENIMEDELEWSKNEPWSATEINDTMWFDFEQICEWLGLDYEEVEERE